jgi:hypothetical protein
VVSSQSVLALALGIFPNESIGGRVAGMRHPPMSRPLRPSKDTFCRGVPVRGSLLALVKQPTKASAKGGRDEFRSLSFPATTDQESRWRIPGQGGGRCALDKGGKASV